MFKGGGSNGKSLVCDVIMSLAGDAGLACSILSLDLRSNNHALNSLPSKRVVIDDDLESGAVLPDGILKKISENKDLEANPKFRDAFHFKACAVVIMCANRNPVIRDLSYATQRRAMVIPFDRQFGDDSKDVNLMEKLRPELPGILNRALAAYANLRERGRFESPEICKTAATEWLAIGNTTAGFIHHCLINTGSQQDLVTMSDAFGAYKRYCQQNGHTRPLVKRAVLGVFNI